MSQPRYLFVGMPATETLESLQAAVRRHALDQTLGSALFDACNWHQSLSDRYWGALSYRDQLMRAGANIAAQAVKLRFNRIASVRGGALTHWLAFRSQGQPTGFAELITAVRSALSTVGLEDRTGHTPHVTISYAARIPIAPVKIEPVIEWTLDEVVLVRGGGAPYRYEVINTWALMPLPADRQLPLF